MSKGPLSDYSIVDLGENSWMTAVVFFLALTNASAFRIQVQLTELLLMQGVHSLLRRQDRTEIVALPRHP